jgi:pilus assembly protein CpaF
MFEILIKQKGHGESVGKLVPGVYRVGSSPAAHIQLNQTGISGQHCQFIIKDETLKIVDMGSTNGTFVDGTKIIANEPFETSVGSVIALGDDIEIVVKGPETPQTINPPPTPPPAVQEVEQKLSNPTLSSPRRQHELTSQIKIAAEEAKKAEKAGSKGLQKIPVLVVSGVPAESRPLVQEIKKRAHIELLKRLNLKRMAISGTSEADLAAKAKDTIHKILSDLTIQLPPGVTKEKIEKELVHEAIGLGPLEDLIDMDDITEIMVNGPNSVYVEHKGTLFKTDTAFADDHQVQAAIERIVSPLGRRIDESSPMVDARLKDGSRVNAIIPPLSLVGPSITIRKFSKNPLQIDDLVRFNSISHDIAKFLDICVKVRKNIIISGGTGSGKTTLLNILSSFLPNKERIVTIEDAAELQLRQDHVVRLESRPPNIEGKGEINIRDLVRNSLRMRPDRIVVGECRGGEALDMLQAMNTGHDGSLTTIHANTPRDALARLETLVLMAGFDLPLRAIREQIASAITIIVQVNREKDGSRKITHVSEITKMEGDIITLQDIFVFKQEGWSDDDKIIGQYVPTGNIPTFMEEIQRAKLDLDISIFSTKPIRRGF